MLKLNSIIFLILFSFPAFAFQVEEKLQNPQQEKQAQELFHEIRCLVCAGESLAESNADFSVDMRALVREQIKQGKNPTEIRKYLVSRYGENILQEPQLTPKTYLLWFAPLLLLAVGSILVFRNVRSS